MGRDPADFLQDVLYSLDQSGPILYEGMAASMATGNDIPRHGEHVPSLFEGHPRGDQGPAVVGRLDDHNGPGQAADDAVPEGEMSRERWRPRRQFAHQAPGRTNLHGKCLVSAWVDDIEAATEDGRRWTGGLEGAAMGGTVDPTGQPGHHHQSG